MIVSQCPVCGHVPLCSEVVTTIPPVYVERCPHCGWRHEEREELHVVAQKADRLQRRADEILQSVAKVLHISLDELQARLDEAEEEG